MSFKSRFLERENERLRKREELLLAALLDRAGHHKAAEILRNEEQIKAALVEQAKKASKQGSDLSTKVDTPEQQPIGRGWRAIKNFWQEQFRKESETENGESTSPGPN